VILTQPEAGVPSLVWRAGQERRLGMIRAGAEERLAGRVLDLGCGIGLYLARLAIGARESIGIEYIFSNARLAREAHAEIAQAAGEKLPLPADAFDLILSHEVLEHVSDDRAVMKEIARVLRPPGSNDGGGRLVLFVPNRGYPFETHGIYWRGSYRFGNIPLVNYLPKKLRDRLAPHVRAYSRSDLHHLLAELPLRIISQGIIFGAYDNIIERWPSIGRSLRAVLQFLEKTPLRTFGLSHFLVLEKTSS
jgi:SAM-dependent methyltransferase